MFNVSLKINRSIAADFQEICEEYFMEYYSYLIDMDDPYWAIEWSNFDHFRLKIASFVIKKSNVNQNKMYRLNINVNACTAFIRFFEWCYQLDEKKLSPFLKTVFMDYKNVVSKEITSMNHLNKYRHNKN